MIIEVNKTHPNPSLQCLTVCPLPHASQFVLFPMPQFVLFPMPHSLSSSPCLTVCPLPHASQFVLFPMPHSLSSSPCLTVCPLPHASQFVLFPMPHSLSSSQQASSTVFLGGSLGVETLVAKEQAAFRARVCGSK